MKKKDEEIAKPQTKMAKFKSFLNDQMKDQVAAILPKHMTPERLCKVLMVEASRSPALLECTLMSVAESMMLSAQLGLEPGATLGHIYFIPFNDLWHQDLHPDHWLQGLPRTGSSKWKGFQA